MMPSKPQFVGERVKLGDVVAAVPGRNADLHCNAVYSVTNSQGFVPSEEYFSKDVFSKDLKSYRVVKRNMIAYNPSRINVGSVALQDKEDEVVVSPLYVIFSTDERKVLPDYVVRFLKSKPGLDQIAFRSIGTVRNNLKFKALCQMTIKLPSLEEQQSRLSNLRSIQNQIDRANRQLAALDSLVKSRFVEMFESNEPNGFISLRECCSKICGGKTPSMKRPEYYGGDIPFVKSGDIKQDSVSSGSLALTAKAVEETGVKIVPKNSVLVVTRSAMLHRKMHSSINTRELAINQDIKAFIPSPSYLPSYLLWAIRSHEQELLAGVRSVSTCALDFNQLCSIRIRKASVQEQQEFADFVAQVDKSRFLHQANAKAGGNILQSSFTSDIGSTFSRRLSLQEGLTLG